MSRRSKVAQLEVVQEPVKVDLTQKVLGDRVILPLRHREDSVDEITANNYLQYLNGAERVAFMDECWRVLKVGGKLVIIVPYWSAAKCVADPRVQWPPINEVSFFFFNKPWREQNNVANAAKCDFDFGYGWSLPPDLAIRNLEYQQNAARHWLNSAENMQVTLTKRP